MKLKSKLAGRLCVIGVVAVILTAVCAMLAFWSVFSSQAQEDLRNYGQILSQAYTQQGEIPEQTLLPDVYRVTLIAPDGSVLYESAAVQGEMENHKDRPEVQQAMENGTGESARQSETLGKVTYYYAQRLDNGDILRVSKQLDSVFSVFQGIIPVLLGIGAYILLICLIMASEMTKGIVKPIEKMAEDTDAVAYDELVPFARMIEAQRKRIREQVEQIHQETDKVNSIIANMEEGFILLDRDKHVLMQNDSAIHLLHAGFDDMIGKSFISLSRNEEVNRCIAEAAEGKNRTVEFTVHKKRLQMLANPVYTNGEQIGVICIIVDVTGVKEVERLRREFTANVSHELKTPLTSISGYAEMIESGIAKEDDVKAFAGKIHREAGRLVTLIGDIIKLSQLEEEPTQIKNGGFADLQMIVQECADTLSLSAQKHDVTIETDLAPCKVKGEHALLYELVYNLCDNAIRYNRQGGKVCITLKQHNGNTVLSVKDTGIGIPKEHQSRIFERFYRVDKSRSKQTGGTGLGLAIVKHVAERYHAQLHLKSEEGKGTEITVTFQA